MIGWIIFLGIIALLLGLLSIPVVLRVEYEGSVLLRLRWLFLTILRIPDEREKKPKKEKKEKPAKEKKEKEKTPKEDSGEPNVLQRFYQYQGIPGFIELLRRTVAALKKFGRGLWRCFRIRELKLTMLVQNGDPKALVEQYGKTCAAVFPLLGWLTTHLRSKRGAVRANISPDFTGLAEKEIAVTAEVSVIPLVLIAAVLGLGVRLAVRVLLKFFRGAKAPKAAPDQPDTAVQGAPEAAAL